MNEELPNEKWLKNTISLSLRVVFLTLLSYIPVMVDQIAEIVQIFTYIGLCQSDQMIRTRVVLQRNYLLAIVRVVLCAFAHYEFKAGCHSIVHRYATAPCSLVPETSSTCRLQKTVYIPACHQSVRGAYCDYPWHLVYVLRVCENPGDRLCMISFEGTNSCLRLLLFRVESSNVQNFERSIVQYDTNLIFTVNGYFSDILLLKLFLVDRLYYICDIVIQKYPLWGYENYVVSHVYTALEFSGKTVSIIEYALFDVYLLGIVKRRAAK